MSWLNRCSEVAFTMLRIMAGAMFAFHGAQKVLGLYASRAQPEIGSQLWVGGIIELLGGLAVMLGLGTRWAAFLCSGTMAVAYFQFHWKLQTGEHFFPAVNGGELAVLYCFVFFFIACRGEAGGGKK